MDVKITAQGGVGTSEERQTLTIPAQFGWLGNTVPACS